MAAILSCKCSRRTLYHFNVNLHFALSMSTFFSFPFRHATEGLLGRQVREALTRPQLQVHAKYLEGSIAQADYLRKCAFSGQVTRSSISDYLR